MMNQTSVGSVEGVPFTACTSGADIIILASNFSRVQQITTRSNITSIDCSTDVGKIAASFGNKIIIFEPIPLQEQNPSGARLDYKWIQTAEIESSTPITVMSLNLEGTKLITGGTTLQLWCIENGIKNNWQCVWRLKTANQIIYLKFSPDGTLFCSGSKHDRLVKIWYEGAKLVFSFIYISHPMPITAIEWRRTSKYTPRGAVANILITSCQDNISRIWIQTLLPDDGLVNFNQLKTNNREETVNGAPRVPAHSHRQKLLRRLKRMKAFSQFKKRQSLALDYSIDELEKADNSYYQNGNGNVNSNNTASIPTAQSAHDFHSYALYTNVVRPGLHFHLAGIIEADYNNEIVHWINNKEIHITRSIELLLHDMLIRILRGNQASSTNSPQSPRESCSGSENDTENEPEDPNDDTITAESGKKLRHKLCSKVNKQRALAASGRRDHDMDENNRSTNPNYHGNNYQQNTINYHQNISNGRASPNSLVEEFDKTLESLLKKWQTSADLLFSINKSDGSLQLWQVNYLDGEDSGVFRQVHIEKLTTLNSALSHYDAITMSLNVIAYSPSAYLDVKRAYLALTNSSGLNGGNTEPFSPVDVPEILSINTDTSSNTKQGSQLDAEYYASANSLSDMEPNIFFVTQHLSGILGLWKMNFGSAYPQVQSIEMVTRITGLPIDPSWLKDGILNVEYMDKLAALLTHWVPDETQQAHDLDTPMKQQSKPSSPNQITNNSQLFQVDFDETKSSLNSHLPSVDEELQGETFDEVISYNNNNIGNNFDYHSPALAGPKDCFRASELATNINILPQYHLKQLIELLAFGKLQRVKAILNNLVNCLLTLENNNQDDSDITSHAPWSHRSRTLSIVAQTPSSFHDSFDIDNPSSNIQQQVMEEVELDYIEVTSIKPLPLYQLIEADNDKSKFIDDDNNLHTTKKEEFSMQDFESFLPARSQVDETLDEILGQSALETLNRQKSLKKKNKLNLKGSLTSFNPRKAKLLTRVLTHTHLPGLTNVDQMHLLAVADAVALFDASASDYNDLQDDDLDSHSQNGTTGGAVTTNIAIDSLDDKGLRFLTAMRQHVYLSRCLPMKQRAELQANGIGNHNLVWAFHSESQDELVSLIPCVNRNKPEWAELREYGIGWWLKKIEVLKKLIEKVAQSAYQAKQDPLDAALFYLAMKKKTLVCALLRRVNCDKRLLKLFELDFNDPINRKKALKNAYALLGLHRFEHAAAFFILAGSIWDAVEVCINNLNDIQLAIVLIRLHDSDSNVPNNLKRLLFTEILGSKRPNTNDSTLLINNNSNSNDTTSTILTSLISRKNSIDVGIQNNSRVDHQPQYQYDSKRAHQDPFLRSMAFWKLSDYLSAVHTLLENHVGKQHRANSTITTPMSQFGAEGRAFFNGIGGGNSSRRNSESLGSNQAATDAGVSGGVTHQHSTNSNRLGSLDIANYKDGNLSISASIFNFYLFLKEQPLVIKHKQQLLEENELRRRTSPIEEEQVHSHRARSLSSGEVNFDEQDVKRAVRQSSTEFEVLNETTGRQIDKYSDEAIAKKERVLFFSTAYSYLCAGCPILALEVLCKEDHLNLSNAQRMKFIACLHILMNELNTLASNSTHSKSNKQPIPPKNTNNITFNIKGNNMNHVDDIGTSSINDYNGVRDNFSSVKFRIQFYEWLNKNIKAMNSICSYVGISDEIIAIMNDDNNKNINNSNSVESESDKSELQAPDMKWVHVHEPILRTMLTYCNLHSANENSLTVVRLELLTLLGEQEN